MHIAISWDIARSTPERWTELNDRLVAVLAPYAWARPLNTYYIVPLASEAQRDSIHQEFLAVAQSVALPERIDLLITPVMVGHYTGYLPSTMWPILSERTG